MRKPSRPWTINTIRNPQIIKIYTNYSAKKGQMIAQFAYYQRKPSNFMNYDKKNTIESPKQSKASSKQKSRLSKSSKIQLITSIVEPQINKGHLVKRKNIFEKEYLSKVRQTDKKLQDHKNSQYLNEKSKDLLKNHKNTADQSKNSKGKNSIMNQSVEFKCFNSLLTLKKQNEAITQKKFRSNEQINIKCDYRKAMASSKGDLDQKNMMSTIQTVINNTFIISKKDKDNKFNSLQFVQAFWCEKNRFVNLIQSSRKDYKYLNHKNLCKVYGQVQIKGSKMIITDQLKNYSLKRFVQQFGPLNENIVKRLIKQIASGLKHMHSHNQYYNYLDLSTIFYNYKQILIDTLRKKQASTDDVLKLNKKRFYFYSPEYITQKCVNSPSNDIWSLGCVTIVLLTGLSLQSSKYHPYNYEISRISKGQQQIVGEIRKYHENMIKNEDTVEITKFAEQFIDYCLKIDKNLRPTIKEILEHPFLTFFQR